LENLRRNGVLNRLHKKAWPKKLRDLSYPWKSVNKEEVAPIFFVLVIGIIVSIAILTIELASHQFRKGKRTME
ncbi:hypothetical protein L9F63_012763, partial [Diploptera punctata]